MTVERAGMCYRATFKCYQFINRLFGPPTYFSTTSAKQTRGATARVGWGFAQPALILSDATRTTAERVTRRHLWQVLPALSEAQCMNRWRTLTRTLVSSSKCSTPTAY